MNSPTRNLRLITLLGIAMFTVVTVRADGIDAFKQGNFTEARTALEARVAADAADGEAQYYLARTLYSQQLADDAAKPIDRAVELLPENADAHYWRGRVYGTLAANANIMSAGRFAKKARSSFEQALEIDANHEDALIGLIQFKIQAPKLVGGSKSEALDLTERLIELNAVEGTLQRADALRSLRRGDEATQLLNALAKERPTDPTVRLRLGFDELNAKNYDTAIDHFAAAAAAPLGDATEAEVVAIYSAKYQVGRSHVFAERPSDDAADALRQYIANAPAANDLPGKDWAHFRLGELLAINGDADKANEHFQQALAQTDDKDLVRRAKSRLN